MKKLLFSAICFVFMLCFTLTASAAPKFWHHPEYNLGSANKFVITAFENKSQSGGNFTAEKNSQDVVVSAVFAAAAKENILVMEDYAAESSLLAKANTKTEKGKKLPDTLSVQITVNKLGYSRRVIPAHYEDKTEYIKVKEGKDNNTNLEIPVSHKVYVPETSIYTAYLEIIYNVYDPVSGDLIFNSRDFRDRGDTYDISGMLERSSKDFIKNIKKSK